MPGPVSDFKYPCGDDQGRSRERVQSQRDSRLRQIVERSAKAFASASGRSIYGDLEAMLFLLADTLAAQEAFLLVSSPITSWQTPMEIVVGKNDGVDLLNRLADFRLADFNDNIDQIPDMAVWQTGESGAIAPPGALETLWLYLSDGKPYIAVPVQNRREVRALMLFSFDHAAPDITAALRSSLLTAAHMGLAFADLGVLDQQLNFRVRLLDESQQFANVGMWEYITGHSDLKISPVLQRLFGIPVEEFANLTSLLGRVHEDERQQVTMLVTTAVSRNEGYSLQCRVLLGDGQYTRLNVVTRVEKIAPGAYRRYGFVRKCEEAAATVPGHLRSNVLKHMDDGVAIFHRDGSVLSVNPAFCKLVGFPEEVLIGCGWGEVAGLWSLPSAPARIIRQSVKDGSWSGEGHFRSGGSSSPLHKLRLVALTDEQQKLEHFSIILKDVSSRQNSKQRLEWLVNVDMVTGLPNRNQIMRRIDSAIANLPTGRRLAVMVLNIDSFQEINDSYGHIIGNELLKAFGERLSDCCRTSNTFLARLGGDEFAVCVSDLETDAELQLLISAVQQVTQRPFDLVDGNPIYATAGMGVAEYPVHGEHAMALVGNADTALHDAKRSGASGVAMYRNDLTEQAANRVQITNDLRMALQGGEGLIIHYQPQVDARHGKIVGLEALIRWQHPRNGLIFPLGFLPCAEDAGLMPEIDRFVLRRVARDLVSWRQQGLQTVTVAVNISQQSFVEGSLLEQLEWLARSHQLQDGDIDLELTEGALLQPTDAVLDMVTAIRKLGFALTIDDFGTGYSSMNYLHRFPLQKLKIDRSFISQLETAEECRVITRNIVRMAQELKLGLVAEGVENGEQSAFLKATGCDVHQGFYYDRALTPEQVVRLLEG